VYYLSEHSASGSERPVGKLLSKVVVTR